MALLKNSTALALLNFDQNQNYLRNLIRMQQSSCRDRGTIKYPVAFYTPDEHLHSDPLSLRDSSNIERTYPLFTRIVYDTYPSDY